MTAARLRAAAAVLGLLGLVIAGYLIYVHYAGIEPVCAGGGGGCERVQGSSYAELAGVPIALLGGLSYVAILLSLASRAEAALLAGAGVALAGFGFSAYLTYVELFELQAICQWCVANAVVMTALAVTTVARAVVG